MSLRLTGPFETQGKGKLPKFKLSTPRLEGDGQNIKAGLTSTGDKGFVTFQGTDYVVSDNVFQPVQGRATSRRQQKARQVRRQDSRSRRSASTRASG